MTDSVFRCVEIALVATSPLWAASMFFVTGIVIDSVRRYRRRGQW